MEERLRRNIHKSRPYFEEKQCCQEQLEAQKARIDQLQDLIQSAKTKYSTALRCLEQISEEIHRQRGDLEVAPSGPREPGVGAELSNLPPPPQSISASHNFSQMPDISSELDKCEIHSVGSMSMTTSSAVSERDPSDDYVNDEELNLELLSQKVRNLAIRPIEGADGQQQEDIVWENELNSITPKHISSHLSSPVLEKQAIKTFKKQDPLPLANVSMIALPVVKANVGDTTSSPRNYKVRKMSM